MSNKIKLQQKLTRNSVGNDFSSLLVEDAMLDFSQVDEVDTAGLAWLLRLLALAKDKNIILELYALPEQLIRLAKISHVDTMLPIKTN